MAFDDLSDEQLRQLLNDAERRMRSARRPGESPSRNSEVCLSTFRQSISNEPARSATVSYIKTTDHGAEVDSVHLVNPEERKLSNAVRRIVDPVTSKRSRSKVKKATAGSDWYNLPRTTLTPELERDLQLLRMRSVLDPKRHYKRDGSKAHAPEFSQAGTIVEGPTEFFSARLSNKERKETFVEEVLAGEDSTHRFQSKFEEIQGAKTSGKKAHYKRMKAQRRG